MPKRRDLNLDEFNISKECYRELLNFCLQYRKKLADISSCYYTRPSRISDTPRGGCTTDPTSHAAMVAMTKRRDVEIIRQSAIEACPACYKALLKYVTEKDVRFETLRNDYSICLNEKEFYKARRRFFFILAKKLHKI